ncbi:FAD-binding protein [Halosquirtibacter xylanolyticus]|uniref:FAD-binding and (Fe-S)-binding domain-containing protein n=1 Tax=Halosquirtibacter xylanolyticus TaxID=3374599 RepID=UPI0037480FA7|nr:FAD-binding protein [Prolixibacteraceae bacterium]
MTKKNMIHWNKLNASIDGDLLIDDTTRTMYATDASLYYMNPSAIVFPKNRDDIVQTIHFANEHNLSITARTAGTSLAGQAIGHGIIVDMSKYMNQIIQIHPQERWVDVEPGVNLSYLNSVLKEHDLQFGPETSTSNRCCIGGMVGNNSCGLHSLIMGSVRDHLIKAEWLLYNGETILLEELTQEQVKTKTEGDQSIESNIYKKIDQIVDSPNFAFEIQHHFPAPELKRRNMGYAMDQISYLKDGQKKINLCKVIAGSEGTLGIGTSFRLNLVPLYPPYNEVITIGFDGLEQALHANIDILTIEPIAIELMDHHIIKAVSKLNRYDLKIYFDDQAQAVLIVEIAEKSQGQLDLKVDALHKLIRSKYNPTSISRFNTRSDISTIWQIRKDGLGVLANLKSKKRSVTVIEDTAVLPSVLPHYIKEFNDILDQNGLECVHYAHIATGELHLRPMLDLEAPSDLEKFKILSKEIALLVKKYRGSLSGEHGDGRLRSPFLKLMYSDQILDWFNQIKHTFDPNNIFNPNVILNNNLITDHLKYDLQPPIPELNTIYRFNNSVHLHDEIDKCTGSGICIRKDHNYSGMCPTYHATNDEAFSTRGRANLLRKVIRTESNEWDTTNPDLKRVLEECLGCKACKLECPSSVDIAKLKSEYLTHYYNSHTPSLRTLMVAYLPLLSQWGGKMPRLTNLIIKADIFKRLVGIAKDSNVPAYSYRTTRSLIPRGHEDSYDVYLYIDEFTNYFDSAIGYKTFLLLQHLDIKVYPLFLKQSGRTYISKGLLNQAKRVANTNAKMICNLPSTDIPILGIEPSCIAAMVDEYMDLVDQPCDYQKQTQRLMLVDKFILEQLKNNPALKQKIRSKHEHIFYHGHCHQKASFGINDTIKMLQVATHAEVSTSNSGCCGMAGSFGYEKEHYQLAVDVGEKALFPAIRSQQKNTVFVASGTSCRHHICKQTSKVVLHPLEYLYSALIL